MCVNYTTSYTTEIRAWRLHWFQPKHHTHTHTPHIITHSWRSWLAGLGVLGNKQPGGWSSKSLETHSLWVGGAYFLSPVNHRDFRGCLRAPVCGWGRSLHSLYQGDLKNRVPTVLLCGRTEVLTPQLCFLHSALMNFLLISESKIKSV